MISNEYKERLKQLAGPIDLIEWTPRKLLSEANAMARRLLELEEANRWIPVSERIPMLGDNQIIAEGMLRNGKVVVCECIHITRINGVCFALDRGKYRQLEVMRWREFPAPPATEQPAQEVKR